MQKPDQNGSTTVSLSQGWWLLSKDWSIGKPWVLSLTAESLDVKDREFGFAGGEGFLVPGAENCCFFNLEGFGRIMG